MNRIYYISPVGSDPEYLAKREALRLISANNNCEIFFPLESQIKFSYDEILHDLKSSKSAIVDLSFERPSCYFELGIARASEIAIQIIAGTGTKIHQTGIKNQSVLYYSNVSEYSEIISSILQVDKEFNGA